MIEPTLLHHTAVYGVSLPTFAVSPAAAKATVYMPSQVAARMLGGRPAKNVSKTMGSQLAGSDKTAT
jgi:hypothetical protein